MTPLATMLVERGEQLRVVEQVGRRAVQLDEVQALHAEVLAAAGVPVDECLWGVVGGDLRHPATHLGGHDEPLTGTLTQEPPDQSLAVAVAVDVGGVIEGDARIRRRVQRGHARRVVHLSPAAADGPRAEPDGADVVAGLA